MRAEGELRSCKLLSEGMAYGWAEWLLASGIHRYIGKIWVYGHQKKWFPCPSTAVLLLSSHIVITFGTSEIAKAGTSWRNKSLSSPFVHLHISLPSDVVHSQSTSIIWLLI
ncbi:hypothetical protein IG631_17356 [Alternaria alternata]|nr:hypothetical protein IG631_17356 [Alternaria alternata]